MSTEQCVRLTVGVQKRPLSALEMDKVLYVYNYC